MGGGHLGGHGPREKNSITFVILPLGGSTYVHDCLHFVGVWALELLIAVSCIWCAVRRLFPGIWRFESQRDGSNGGSEKQQEKTQAQDYVFGLSGSSAWFEIPFSKQTENVNNKDPKDCQLGLSGAIFAWEIFCISSGFFRRRSLGGCCWFCNRSSERSTG